MTDQLPSKELKPCPFCGSSQINVVEGDTFRWRVAECGGCGAHAPDVRIQTSGPGTPKEWEGRGRADALAEWNKRAAQPPGDG